MNLIEVAEKRDEIAARQDVYCPVCSNRQYSMMDKLYVVAFDKCINCSPINEVEENGVNILNIIGTWND